MRRLKGVLVALAYIPLFAVQTITVHAQSYNSSVFGASRCFSGTLGNYVEVPNSSLNNLPQGTVEAWVNLNSQNLGKFIITRSLDDGSDGDVRLAIDESSGKFYFTLNNGNTRIFSILAPSVGVWYHVAGTWNGSRLTLFVNGVQQDFRNTVITLQNKPTWKVYFGRIGGDTPGNLNGQIDEVRFSSKVRTPQEFALSAPKFTDANTIGLWHMDDQSATTVVDASANHYNGTVFGTGCVSNQPTIVHVYTDIVQTLSYRVSTLVPDRPTAVRVTYKMSDPSSKAEAIVKAKLFITKITGIGEIPSSPLSSDPERMTIKNYYSQEEIARAENTINFYLGTLDAGTYSVYVDINGVSGPVKTFTLSTPVSSEPALVYGERVAPLTKLKILFQPTKYKNKEVSIRDEIFGQSTAYVQKVFPLPDGAVKGVTSSAKFEIGEIGNDYQKANEAIGSLRKILQIFNEGLPLSYQADAIVAVTVNSIGEAMNEVVDALSNCGTVSTLYDRIGLIETNSLAGLAHELGHMFGLGDEWMSFWGGPVQSELCSSTNSRANDCIKGDHIGNWNMEQGATDVRVKEQREFIPDKWNFLGSRCYDSPDAYYYTGVSPTWVEHRCKGGDRRTHSFMGQVEPGYGCASTSLDQVYWTTSDCDARLNQVFTNWSFQSQSKKMSTPGEYFDISGVIDASNVVQLSPIRTMTGLYDPPVGSSSFSLSLVDSLGGVLSAHTLDISLQSNDSGTLPSCGFVALIPFDTNAKSVNIARNSLVIKSMTRSMIVPTISLLSPNGGEFLSGLTSINWNATDLDSDTLWVSIYYKNESIDWELLALNVVGSSMEYDFNGTPGGDQGLIKVVVSDGFNSSADSSDNYFTVANASPVVTIIHPADSTTVLQRQTLVLIGDCYDPEGEAIDSSQRVWSSNVAGVIGSDNTLEIASLAPGYHTIDFTASDTHGGIGSDTVFVLVVADIDSDGVADDWELSKGLSDTIDESRLDPDGDGLSNRQEWLAGTEPYDADSDDDSFMDGIENGYLSDPNDPVSTPVAISSVALIFPVNASIVSGDTVHFAWNPSTHDDQSIVINYQLEISSDPAFTEVLVFQTSESTSYSISSLFSPGSTYYWRVKAMTLFGSEVYSGQSYTFTYSGCCIKEGDFNHNNSVNVIDVASFVSYLFKSGPVYGCKEEADFNDGGTVNVVDLTLIVNYLFKGGPITGCP